MILYLDTSALIKIYVQEVGTETVRDALRSGRVAISALGGAELAGALARLAREGDLSASQAGAMWTDYLRRLPTFLEVVVEGAGSPLGRDAARLCFDHHLRGGDAVHLASALQVVAHHPGESVSFCAADVKLLRAARAERLTTVDCGT